MGIREIEFRKDLVFPVTDDARGPAYFVFGVRKSGSSVLNSIVAALADLNGVNYLDVAGTFFDRGMSVPEWQSDAALEQIVWPGNVYGGFRNYPLALHGMPSLKTSKKILMVRDPRDALVSEYFSNAYSHSVPVAGEGRDQILALRARALETKIDEYVVKMAPALAKTLQEYMLLDEVGGSSCTFRYEDVILHKDILIREICSYFEWTITDAQIKDILRWADVIPEKEEPTQFVRKVTPGDHKEKLSPTAVRQVEEILGKQMKFFGYA